MRLECLETRTLLSFNDIGLQLTSTKGAWGDINNDGWTDLFDGKTVWRNDGGTLTQLQALGTGPHDSFEGVLGDFDNDGFLDIFAYETFQLWRNVNGTSFVEVSSMLPSRPMESSRAAVWGDFNGDSYLDLYVGGYESPAYQLDALLLNNAGQSFSLAWTQLGDSTRSPGNPRPGRGVTAADWDQDGDLDVYVTNYRLEPNQLRQNGPGGDGLLSGLGWGLDAADVAYSAGVGLTTNVAHAPSSNTTTTKPFSGSVGSQLTLTADMYLTGIYDTAGGEGMVGIDDGLGNIFLIGPQANPLNPGYPGPGGGGWGVLDGLGGAGRINITDGGSPGVGNQFKGIGSGTVQVEMAIDQIANTISIDIYDLVGGAPLNPTWVMPLTPTAEAALATIDRVILTWNDVISGDTRELDNITVTSPDPGTVIFSEDFEGSGFSLSNDVAPDYNATADPGHGIGSAFGDFDNDGLIDLFAGNFAHEGQPQSRFLRNLGPGSGYTFEDLGTSGVYYQESYASPVLGDIDNDGDLDLFFTAVNADPAVLFRNDTGSGGSGELSDLGWGQNAGSVAFGPGAGLPTSVAHAPAANSSTTKSLSGPIGNQIVLTADMYLTGVYDVAGGEGMVGLDNGTGTFDNALLVGPNANPLNPGYPGPGGGGWVLWDGLDTLSRINITDGGAPGVGNQFKGIGSGTVQVEMTIDQIANTISVDIYDLVGGSLNPTWTMPLTATAEAALANIDSVMLTWNDVHPGDMREVDNITVVSPVPNTVIFSEDFAGAPGSGDWIFTDVTSQWGLGGISGGFNYAAAFADYDNDGDLDLTTDLRVYANNQTSGNNWLKVRLEGAGTTINRSAIGAQVRASFDGITATRQVEAGTGEGNQNDLTLHFGLGTYSGNIDLEVTWPGGTTQSLTVMPNQTTVVSLLAEQQPDRTWNLDSSGDWNGNNWTGGPAPNANNESAIFAGGITSPHTVFTDTAVTVKGITFDNDNTYVIAGAGSVTLSSDTNTSTIDVLQGDHQFQAVVNLSNATEVHVAAGSTLTFNNALNLGGNTLTKTGAGTLTMNNSLSTGGGSIVVAAGSLGGSGEVGGDLVNSGGTLSPGDSSGTQSVGGNLTQATAADGQDSGSSRPPRAALKNPETARVSAPRQASALEGHNVSATSTIAVGILDRQLTDHDAPTPGDLFDIGALGRDTRFSTTLTASPMPAAHGLPSTTEVARRDAEWAGATRVRPSLAISVPDLRVNNVPQSPREALPASLWDEALLSLFE